MRTDPVPNLETGEQFSAAGLCCAYCAQRMRDPAVFRDGICVHADCGMALGVLYQKLGAELWRESFDTFNSPEMWEAERQERTTPMSDLSYLGDLEERLKQQDRLREDYKAAVAVVRAAHDRDVESAAKREELTALTAERDGLRLLVDGLKSELADLKTQYVHQRDALDADLAARRTAAAESVAAMQSEQARAQTALESVQRAHQVFLRKVGA